MGAAAWDAARAEHRATALPWAGTGGAQGSLQEWFAGMLRQHASQWLEAIGQ